MDKSFPLVKRINISVQILGFLFFGALLFLAWIFFKERMINYDPAFFSFRIIHEKNYDIELGRWGSVVSQVLPLWFLKSGCSLETFLRVYSISFILIYYLIFLLITVGLRNTRAGIILMFSLCLAFRHVFYYPTAELYQGIAICVLIWALTFPEKEYESTFKRVIAFVIVCIFVFILSYYHQIIVFPLLFIFLFSIIEERRYTDKFLLGALLLTALWFFIRIKFLTNTSYEQGKIPAVKEIFSQIGNIKQMPSYIYFKSFVRHFLLFLAILNLVCVVEMLYRKKILLSAFYILFNIGFIYLILVTFKNGESPIMYENYITILGLFCAIPLSKILLKIRWSHVTLPLIAFILLINVKNIYGSHVPFTHKQEYLKRIAASARQMPEKKYVIDSRNLPWHYDWISWALPFETLLYSSLESPDSAVSVCVATPVSQYDSISTWKNVFLGPPWAITWFWIPDIDKKFYSLPDGPYAKLTTAQKDTSFNETLFNKDNIFIEALDNFIEIGKEKYATIPIRIKNKSGFILRSIPDIDENVKLSYHLLNEKGDYVLWDGNRTSLETDIRNESYMALIVNPTISKGKYLLLIDFLTEGKRWWGINTKVKLNVN
jgi:hypothetical protein